MALTLAAAQGGSMSGGADGHGSDGRVARFVNWLFGPQDKVGPIVLWVALSVAWCVGWFIAEKRVFALVWALFAAIWIARLVSTYKARRRQSPSSR